MHNQSSGFLPFFVTSSCALLFAISRCKSYLPYLPLPLHTFHTHLLMHLLQHSLSTWCLEDEALQPRRPRRVLNQIQPCKKYDKWVKAKRFEKEKETKKKKHWNLCRKDSLTHWLVDDAKQYQDSNEKVEAGTRLATLAPSEVMVNVLDTFGHYATAIPLAFLSCNQSGRLTRCHASHTACTRFEKCTEIHRILCPMDLGQGLTCKCLATNWNEFPSETLICGNDMLPRLHGPKASTLQHWPCSLRLIFRSVTPKNRQFHSQTQTRIPCQTRNTNWNKSK